MFFKKNKIEKANAKVETSLKSSSKAKRDDGGTSPLLERSLQKNMTDHMRNASDEALAKAIQTLLYEEKNKNKHLN